MKSPNPDAIVLNAVLEEVCLGNRDAYDYMWVWIQSTRLIDDLFDEIDTWKDENTYELAQRLLFELPANRFFCANSAALLPHHLTVLNAWRDSKRMEEIRGQSERVTCVRNLRTNGRYFYISCVLNWGI